ncbi:hypothetical protein [Microcoleus sp. FACHB-831]|nr:hypothetical protein [Microcoleus sp. FACHB-831]
MPKNGKSEMGYKPIPYSRTLRSGVYLSPSNEYAVRLIAAFTVYG